MPAIAQENWGGGIYRGRKAPAGTVYDAVDALVDDEANLFKRGAAAYKSTTDASDTLDMLVDVFVAAGRRTVFGSEAGNMYALGVDDATPTLLTSTAPRALSRVAASSGMVFFPANPADPGPARAYGGSLKSAGYTTGTVTVTNGSATVDGAGTSWLANIDPGMMLGTAGLTVGVVKSVDSDTQITLIKPWAGSDASGAAYGLSHVLLLEPAPVTDYGITGGTGVYLTSVGTGQRLVIATRQRAFISEPDAPFSFAGGSYLEIPSDSVILGADAMLDSAILWTTGGVWRLSNLDFDSVDDLGNIQWQQEQISKDVILWGDAGVAAWKGAFVVPALDDVFIFAIDGTAQAVSESIRPLYRSHVQAGRRPGIAKVHRGHYLLPILEGSEVVDTLVCRLDQGGAWTRWTGMAASAAFAQRVDTDGEPLLLGLAGERVTDLTAVLDGDGSVDADEEPIEFSVTTSDYPTGRNQPGTVQRLRLRYELDSDEASTTDTFERADETPLGSPYLNWLTGGKPNLSGGSVVSNGTIGGFTTRPETVGPTCSATAEFDSQATQDGITSYLVGARLTTHTNSAGGYSAWLQPGTGSGWKVVIRRAGATIATSPVTNYVDVSGIRIVCSGNRITGYAKVSGDWVEAVSVSDDIYPDAGYVGFGLQTFSIFGSPVGIEAFTWTEAASLKAEFSSDQDSDAFAQLTHGGGQDGTVGAVDSDGSRYTWWRVAKRRERIRFRFTVQGAGRFVLRTLEAPFRQSGRQ